MVDCQRSLKAVIQFGKFTGAENIAAINRHKQVVFADKLLAYDARFLKFGNAASKIAVAKHFANMSCLTQSQTKRNASPHGVAVGVCVCKQCYSVVVGKQFCCLTDVSLLKFHLTIP